MCTEQQDERYIVRRLPSGPAGRTEWVVRDTTTGETVSKHGDDADRAWENATLRNEYGGDPAVSDARVKLGPAYTAAAGQGGWSVRGMDGAYVVDGYDTEAAAWLAALETVRREDSPQGRWDAVAEAFGQVAGDLYVDTEHTEPLWHMAWPSVDTAMAGDHPLEVQVAECATRVAAAIAVLAYGTAAVQDQPPHEQQRGTPADYLAKLAPKKPGCPYADRPAVVCRCQG